MNIKNIILIIIAIIISSLPLTYLVACNDTGLANSKAHQRYFLIYIRITLLDLVERVKVEEYM